MSDINSAELWLGHNRIGHGVTRRFDGAIPLGELRNDLFDWEAVEVDTYADFVGQRVEIPNRKALLRVPGGVVLGTPSKSYAPHQYQRSLLDGLSTILRTGDLSVDAAGLTGYGAKAWVSVSLVDTITTAEGVEFLPRIFAIGSHDSTIASTYKRGALNMICNNMIPALRRDKTGGVVKVKHTAGSVLRLESAQEALGILSEIEDELSLQIRELCQQEVTKAQWNAFVEAHVPLAEDAPLGRGRTLAENTREALHGLYNGDERCAPWAGTAWGVVQTVNTHTRWEATVRGAERSERNQERDITTFWEQHDAATLNTLERVLVTV